MVVAVFSKIILKIPSWILREHRRAFGNFPVIDVPEVKSVT